MLITFPAATGTDGRSVNAGRTAQPSKVKGIFISNIFSDYIAHIRTLGEAEGRLKKSKNLVEKLRKYFPECILLYMRRYRLSPSYHFPWYHIGSIVLEV